MKPHSTPYSWQVLATLALLVHTGITSSVAQERDRKVLFIGGQDEPTQATDGDVMEHLQERYGEANVSYSSGDNSSPGDADSVDLVIISSTLGSGSVRGKFHRSSTPVLNWEEALVDQARQGNWPFTEGARTKSTEENLVIVNTVHPIAQHLGLGEGPLAIFVEDGGKTWSAAGPLPGEAFIIADTQSSFDLEPEFTGAAIFGIDKGGKLFDEAEGEGFTATAKSIHFAMEDDSPGAFTEVGWKFFDACLDWLTDDLTDGSDPDAAALTTVSFDLLPDEADQALDIKIRNANTEATQMLELSDFALSGPNASQFSITEPLPGPIAAGGEGILKLAFNNEKQLGTFRATLTFNTNDPDEDDKILTTELVAKVPNPDGPFAHYRLDETDAAGEVIDSTTNLNVAAFDGSVTLGETGLKDGTETSVTVAGGGQLVLDGGLPLNESFSIALWLNATSPAEELVTIVAQGDSNPTVALLLTGNELQWFGGEGPEVLFSTTSKPIAAGTTYHVTMIYDAVSGQGSIYVDGAQVASGDVGQIDPDGSFYAGAFGSGILPLAGTLDDIQIYNRILTPDDEVGWLIENPGEVLNPFRDDPPVVDPIPPSDLKITKVVVQEIAAGVDLTFTSEPGRDYEIQVSSKLDRFSRLTDAKGAEDATETTVNVSSAGLFKRYYRIGEK